MRELISGIRERLETFLPSPDTMWTDIPLGQEPLTEIMLFGNGKDADVVIELLDGRHYSVGLGRGLHITGCPGLEVETLRWDDRSLAIRYFGPDLVLSRLRCEVPTWGDINVDEFREEIRRWVASGGGDELLWALSLKIELTQPGQASTRVGGPCR